VYPDVAVGTGSKCRSIHGLAVYFGGCVIAWQTTVPPFATHSTAESELVGYCGSLNAGRSAEAMLANMMGVPSGGSAIERILYGDKVAAIGLALHGGHEDSKKPWRVVRLEACGDYYIF